MSDDPILKPLMGCSAAATCDSFRACLRKQRAEKKEVEEGRRQQTRVGRLKALLAEGQYQEAHDECRLFRSVATADFKDLCQSAATSYAKVLERRFVKQRDEFGVMASPSECRSTYGETMRTAYHGQQNARATILCDEVQAAHWIQAARTAVAKRLEELSTVVPFECTHAIRLVEKIESEWARKAVLKLEGTCGNYPRQLLGAIRKKWVRSRDGELPVDGLSCHGIRLLESKLTHDDQLELAEMCSEIETQRLLVQAVEAVEKQRDQPKPLLPYACSQASKQLSLGDSTWTKKQFNKIILECYVDLGRKIIETNGATKHFPCPVFLKTWFRDAVQYRSRSEALQSLVLSVESRCAE